MGLVLCPPSPIAPPGARWWVGVQRGAQFLATRLKFGGQPNLITRLARCQPRAQLVVRAPASRGGGDI